MLGNLNKYPDHADHRNHHYSRPRAVVISWFYDNQVGFLDFSYRLAALAKSYRLTIIARRPLTDSELVIPDAEVIVFPSKVPGTRELIQYWFQVRSWLHHQRADVVILLGSQISAIANFHLSAPAAVYWNEHPSHVFAIQPAPKGWVTGALRRLAYRGARSADLVMPIGRAHEDDLLAHGCARTKVELLAMGVAASFSTVAQTDRAHSPDNFIKLVYAGSVHPDRGRDIMIDAVALANRTGHKAQLTIVGADAEQLVACAQRANKTAIGDALHVLPRMPGHLIPKILAAADFGICIWADKPYWRFNPPTKLFEYLAAGLPVLASNIATHTTYITDGVDGYIFDYEVDSLARAIARAWAARSALPTMRTNAARNGQQYFWSNIEPRFLRLIDRIQA